MGSSEDSGRLEASPPRVESLSRGEGRPGGQGGFVRYFVGGSLGVVAAALLGTVTGGWMAARTSRAQRELLRAEWAITISTGMNTAAFWVLVLLPVGLLFAYLIGRLGGRA